MTNLQGDLMGKIVEHYFERELRPGLVIKKTGKCRPEKCGSACCKFYMIQAGTDTHIEYWRGFYDKEDDEGNLYNVRNCKNLDLKKNKCKLWGTNKFPPVCRAFPTINDVTYRHIMEVCTFKFIICKERSTLESMEVL